MPAQDIGPTWGDWADAAFVAEFNTKSSVISRTDSQHRQSQPSSGLPPIWSRDICSVTVRAGPRPSLSFLVLHSVGTEMARPPAAGQGGRRFSGFTPLNRMGQYSFASGRASYGHRYGEVVQRPEGLWLHSTRGRREGRVRPHHRSAGRWAEWPQ